jgi:UDP-N-acetylmuramoylalanine--D-glutamate ligase
MTNAHVGMKVNVVGLGATGLSLVRYLHANGANVRAFDSRADAVGRDRLASEFPTVPFTQIDLHRDQLPSADMIAISPGVARSLYALKREIDHGVSVIGDIELFAQLNNKNSAIFAITGSNGKTTTARLSGALALGADSSAKVAGNVGLPVLDAVRESPNTRTWIVELSSFQLESTSSLDCECAAVLNVSENHLDRYPSFFAYAASKERIFAHAKRQVVNRDDVWSASMRKFSGDCVSFGRSIPRSTDDYGIDAGYIVRGNTPVIATEALQIRGTHNVMNAMAALAVTASLNIPLERTQRALREFNGVAHRYQWLGNLAGIEVVNDSKATTVVATAAALVGSDAPTWLIAGGDGKGQSFAALATAAARCRSVHLIGKDAAAITSVLAGKGIPHRCFESLEDATIAALDQAEAGDRLLLSPACASWDMFRNFEHRADVFASCVRDWARAHGKALTKERDHA